jgi:hypothetical protein
MTKGMLEKRLATLETTTDTFYEREIIESPAFQALRARFEELTGLPLPEFMANARKAKYAVEISDEAADTLGAMIALGS